MFTRFPKWSGAEPQSLDMWSGISLPKVGGLVNQPLSSGRICLTAGIPFEEAKTLSSTNSAIYYDPCSNAANVISLPDEHGNLRLWELNTITRDPATTYAGGGWYDVFIWRDRGRNRMFFGPVWASGNGSARTTAGRLCLLGNKYLTNGRPLVNQYAMGAMPAQRGLYVGTVAGQTLSSSAAFADTYISRLVLNHYNKILKSIIAAGSGGYVAGDNADTTFTITSTTFTSKPSTAIKCEFLLPYPAYWNVPPGGSFVGASPHTHLFGALCGSCTSSGDIKANISAGLIGSTQFSYAGTKFTPGSGVACSFIHRVISGAYDQHYTAELRFCVSAGTATIYSDLERDGDGQDPGSTYLTGFTWC